MGVQKWFFNKVLLFLKECRTREVSGSPHKCSITSVCVRVGVGVHLSVYELVQAATPRLRCNGSDRPVQPEKPSGVEAERSSGTLWKSNMTMFETRAHAGPAYPV